MRINSPFSCAILKKPARFPAFRGACAGIFGGFSALFRENKGRLFPREDADFARGKLPVEGQGADTDALEGHDLEA